MVLALAGAITGQFAAVWFVASQALSKAVFASGMLLIAAAPFLAIPGLSDEYPVNIPKNSPMLGGALMACAAFTLCHWCRDFWQIPAAAILCLGIFWSVFRLIPNGLNEHAHAVGLEVLFYSIMITGGASAFMKLDDFPPWIATPIRAAHEVFTKWNGSIN